MMMNTISLFSKSREFKNRLAQMSPRLFRLAYSWTHDSALADDLSQEAIEKALKNANQLRDKEKLESWVFGILSNCYRDHFRKRREFEAIDEDMFTEENNPAINYEKLSITASVRDALKRLSDNHRQVVTLIDLEGCSYSEVSEILGIPPGTVMSRLCRARKELASKLLQHSTENEQVSLRRIK